MAPVEKSNFGVPGSNLRPFGGKYIVLMKVGLILVTLLGLLGAPAVIRRRRIVPPGPFVTPLTTLESW